MQCTVYSGRLASRPSSRILPVARTVRCRAGAKGAGSGGPCCAATCCGLPCELRQGSPQLLSEAGHCMLCNAMPDEDRADPEPEMWVMHCHAPPCAPVFIAPRPRGTGTCTPLDLHAASQHSIARIRYRNMLSRGTCTSSVDPPTHQGQAFLPVSFALRPSPFSLPKTDPVPVAPKHLLLPPRSKKRKKPNRVTWAPSTARPSTPKLGTLREPEAEPRYLLDQTPGHLPSRACAARLARGSTACNCTSCSQPPSGPVCCDLSCRVPPRADEAYRVRNDLRACVACSAEREKKTHTLGRLTYCTGYTPFTG